MSRDRFYSRAMIGVTFVAAPLSSAVSQAETTTFTYDAIGRVVEVESVRSVETVEFDYDYDNANNRTQQVVTEQTTLAAEAQEPGLAAELPPDAEAPEGASVATGAPQR